MLNRGGDEMTFLRVGSCGAENGDIVRFRRASGEDDFRLAGANCACSQGSRRIDRAPGFISVLMLHARRVTEDFPQIGFHRIDHERVDWCRRVVIKVER